ncbi:hypothetical protein BBP40_005223 [Aspergillus hancockii]|nr:hypothetical protein BBP40_005223 [Aspergillus hancockii]
MFRTSDNEQLEFLLSCIRHSNAGKVDFEEVAKECNVVTKGAAAKRYERLTKSRNNTPGSTAAKTASPASSSKKSGVTKRRKAAPSKKETKKKLKELKVIAVARAENLVAQWTDSLKVEDESLEEETEIEEGAVGVKAEDSDVDA